MSERPADEPALAESPVASVYVKAAQLREDDQWRSYERDVLALVERLGRRDGWPTTRMGQVVDSRADDSSTWTGPSWRLRVRRAVKESYPARVARSALVRLATEAIGDAAEERNVSARQAARMASARDQLAGGRPHLPGEVVDACLAAVAGRDPVLHIECGDGALVLALVGRGVRAEGTDHRVGAVSQAAARGAVVRLCSTRQALDSMDLPQSGALVVSGAPDHSPPIERLEMVADGLAFVRSGGRLVLVGVHPEHWEEVVGIPSADVAPDRPWHPDTWQALLEIDGDVLAQVSSTRQWWVLTAGQAS